MWQAWLYGLVTWLLLPVWPLFMWRRLRRGKEDPRRWLERWGIYRQAIIPNAIWLHAASVGEWRSLQPVLNAVWQQNETQQFIITTQTRTAAQLITQMVDARLQHVFAPWDHPLTVATFLKKAKPRAAIFVESELWPHLLTALRKNRIPALLFNAQLSTKAVQRWQGARGWLVELLTAFQTIITPNIAETARFQQLGIPNVQTGISLKYASPPLACEVDDLFAWRDALAGRPIWLAASTHAGEEDIILAAHQILKKQFPNLLTVIAPRHPPRCPELFADWQNNYRVQKSSALNDFSQPEFDNTTEVILIDQLGELGLWFRLCPITFLGGSLVPVGGHNLIEPAQLACAILHGPYMDSCRDVAEILQAAQASQTVITAAELATAIAQFLNDPTLLHTTGKGAQQAVFNQQHAAQAMIEQALTIL